jgi:hypothetical protein
MQPAEHEQPPSRRKAPARSSFDSLTYAKELQTGGVFTREQAEMLAFQQASLIDERLATKEDIEGLHIGIEALRLATQKDIEGMRVVIEQTAERTKAEILKWMFGQTLVIIAAVIGILRAGIH